MGILPSGPSEGSRLHLLCLYFPFCPKTSKEKRKIKDFSSIRERSPLLLLTLILCYQSSSSSFSSFSSSSSFSSCSVLLLILLLLLFTLILCSQSSSSSLPLSFISIGHPLFPLRRRSPPSRPRNCVGGSTEMKHLDSEERCGGIAEARLSGRGLLRRGQRSPSGARRPAEGISGGVQGRWATSCC